MVHPFDACALYSCAMYSVVNYVATCVLFPRKWKLVGIVMK